LSRAERSESYEFRKRKAETNKLLTGFSGLNAFKNGDN
jgi:hypothetical protein